jgi:hypothetical protein
MASVDSGRTGPDAGDVATMGARVNLEISTGPPPLGPVGLRIENASDETITLVVD